MTRIASEIGATIAALDALHAPISEKRAHDRAALESIVAGLGVPWGVEPEDEPVMARGRLDPATGVGRGERDLVGAHGLPEPRPGHAFGPAARAKLLADAQDGGSW